jgi:hypothetical protein
LIFAFYFIDADIAKFPQTFFASLGKRQIVPIQAELPAGEKPYRLKGSNDSPAFAHFDVGFYLHDMFLWSLVRKLELSYSVISVVASLKKSQRKTLFLTFGMTFYK